MIDLQLIAQNLMDTNSKITSHFQNGSKEPLTINTAILSKKYPDLKKIGECDLIKFYASEDNKTIYFRTLYIVNHDGLIALYDTSNNPIPSFEIKSYEFTEIIQSVAIEVNKTPLMVNALISKKAMAKIAKSEVGSITGEVIDIDLLEEKIIFTPLKNIVKGDYKVINIHNKKSKKYKDLLVDIENIDIGEIIRYVACNTELSKLVTKYKKDCKFSIVDHQKFTNKDDKNSVKVVIKDLNFTTDLSNLDIL